MWGQRLEVYVRSSFTVANLRDLWSNYLRSIWHVIGLMCEKWGLACRQAQILGAVAPILPVETPLGVWAEENCSQFKQGPL